METKKKPSKQTLTGSFAKQVDKYETMIDNQITKIKENAAFGGAMALAGGIAFATVYWLTKSRSHKKEKKLLEPAEIAAASNLPVVVKPRKELHPVLQIFWESIAMFLLAIAKEKILEYLEKIEKKANTSEKEEPSV
jgi:hypothetical protein